MGEFEDNKAYRQWKWVIPKNYNIGADVIDKHAASKNRNKIALYWRTLREQPSGTRSVT